MRRKTWLKKICGQCKEPFEVSPAFAAQKFCVKACYDQSMRKTETRTCVYCGKDVVKRPCDFSAAPENTYCNHKCRAWDRSRQAVRKRFGSRMGRPHHDDIYGRACLICGWDRCIEYCHVIPAKKGGTIHPDNILVMCPNHHTLFDREQLNPDETAAIAERVTRAHESEFSTSPLLTDRCVFRSNRKG